MITSLHSGQERVVPDVPVLVERSTRTESSGTIPVGRPPDAISGRGGERLRDHVEGLVQELVADRERWQEAEDVAPGAAGEGDDAVAVAVRRGGSRAGRVRLHGAGL